MPDDTTMSSAPISDCQPSPALTRSPETIEGSAPGSSTSRHDAQAARAERARCLGELALHQLRAAIGVEHARRERPGEDHHHRPADAGAEPERREGHPGERRDIAIGFEDRRHHSSSSRQ